MEVGGRRQRSATIVEGMNDKQKEEMTKGGKVKRGRRERKRKGKRRRRRRGAIRFCWSQESVVVRASVVVHSQRKQIIFT